MSRLIFTMVFGLLLFSATAGNGKPFYFVGVWNGNALQINNPNVVNKNKFCVSSIRINGVKVKTNYKIGGIEIDPANYGFKKGQELLIEISGKKDCEPTFHSEGFNLQL